MVGPYQARPGLVVVAGVRGSGKSWFLRRLAHETEPDQLVYVHDAIGDWRAWSQIEPLPPNVILRGLEEPDELAEQALNHAPCTIIYDELALALPSKGSPSESFYAREIVFRGRHYGVTLIGATQRPKLVSADLRALVSTTVLFRIKSDLDLKWLAEFVDPEYIERLPTLPDKHFIVIR